MGIVIKIECMNKICNTVYNKSVCREFEYRWGVYNFYLFKQFRKKYWRLTICIHPLSFSGFFCVSEWFRSIFSAFKYPFSMLLITLIYQSIVGGVVRSWSWLKFLKQVLCLNYNISNLHQTCLDAVSETTYGLTCTV